MELNTRISLASCPFAPRPDDQFGCPVGPVRQNGSRKPRKGLATWHLPVRLGGTRPPVSLPARRPGERLPIAKLIRSLILSPGGPGSAFSPCSSCMTRTVDVILAFPQVVFALLLLSLLGPKLWLIVLAVGFSHAPQVARVLRSATLDISERDYVKAAELQGMRSARVMLKEILPNLSSPLMVEVGLRLTYSIVIMAGLAFLGFGQQPPAPNWGYMINENSTGLSLNPWAVIVPAALIALLTIGTNTFTDAVGRVAIGVDRRPEEAALLDDLGPGTST